MITNPREKTELCKNYSLYNDCKYGDACKFAHGESEIRYKTKVSLHYKIKPCKQFSEIGFCPYGGRCQFLHQTQSYDEIATSYAEKLNVWIEKNPKLDMGKILKKTHTYAPRLEISQRLVEEGRKEIQAAEQARCFEADFIQGNQYDESPPLEAFGAIKPIKILAF